MKKITFILLLLPFLINGQEVKNEKEIVTSQVSSTLNSINKLFENKEYLKARVKIKEYFSVERDKTTDEYREMLQLLVEVKKEIEKAESKEVSFMIIEDVPIFPGCVGDRKVLKKCFGMSIQRHFANNFNPDLPNNLGLSDGKKKVFIGFKIDRNGYVVNILARGPHLKIEEEVIRVMKLLPKMIPGKVRGENVSVKYSIPFTMIVEGPKKETRKQRRERRRKERKAKRSKTF